MHALQPATKTVDPCVHLRFEFTRLAAEVGYLRYQVLLAQTHDGPNPFEHFPGSADEDLMPDPAGREWFEYGMGHDCPFYLQPGEALEVPRNARGDTMGPGSTTERPVRFLGPTRVLREAKSEWIARAKVTLGTDAREVCFGEPIPPRDARLCCEPSPPD